MNKKYFIAIGVSLVLVISIAIAYAALQTTLTVTVNKVTQNALTWNVGFNPTSGSVTGTAVGSSDWNRSCGTATIASATTITVADSQLTKPGDACIYKFTIKNSGGITAKLSSAKPTAPSGITCTTTNASSSASAKMVCGNITYQLVASATPNTTTYDITTTNFTTGHTIAANATKDVYLVAQYTGSAPSDAAVNHTGGKFTIIYGQA